MPKVKNKSSVLTEKSLEECHRILSTSFPADWDIYTFGIKTLKKSKVRIINLAKENEHFKIKAEQLEENLEKLKLIHYNLSKELKVTQNIYSRQKEENKKIKSKLEVHSIVNLFFAALVILIISIAGILSMF